MKNSLFNYCQPVIDEYSEVECVNDIIGGIAYVAIGIVLSVTGNGLPCRSEDGEILRIDVIVTVKVTDATGSKIEVPDIAGNRLVVLRASCSDNLFGENINSRFRSNSVSRIRA